VKRRVSAASRRNTSRLQSSVLSNTKIIEELKDAEKKASEEDEPVEARSSYSFTPSPHAETEFRRTKSFEALNASRQIVKHDLESARDSSAMMVSSFGGGATPTWEVVLLRSYDSLSKEPPASQTLGDLPWNKTNSASFRSSPSHNNSPQGTVDADVEVGTLLKEWTKVSDEAIKMYRSSSKKEEKSQTVPPWVPDE
jgi:hypothetical protein